MIALVLVSHSASLAAGVLELAREMAGDSVPIVTAAGIKTPELALGTDPLAIAKAIQSVEAYEAVLVLMDVGSALLSTEMALELLSEAQRARVYLSPAPFVEGALAAAVQARLGHSIAQIMAEAEQALQPKIMHIADHAATDYIATDYAATDSAATRRDSRPAATSPVTAALSTHPAYPKAVLAEARLAESDSVEAQAETMDTDPVSLAAPLLPAALALQEEPVRLELSIPNRLGMHARPAARLVETLSRFDAKLQLRNQSSPHAAVSAHSITAVATLGLRYGQVLEVEARGAQAHEALQALQALAAANFGDDDAPPVNSAHTAAATPWPHSAAAQSTNDGSAHEKSANARSANAQSVNVWSANVWSAKQVFSGLSASQGCVVGLARRWQAADMAVPQHRCSDPEAEWQHLHQAIAAQHQRLEHLHQRLAKRSNDPSAAAILQAQQRMLEDSELLAAAQQHIQQQQANAAAAWHQTCAAVATRYQSLDDSYLQARAADIHDLDIAVRQLLSPTAPANIQRSASPQLAILLADDLAPSQVAQLNSAEIAALCTVAGGPTSHSAILARSLGIATVVACAEAILSIPEGTPLLLDAAQGRLYVEPDQASLQRYADYQRQTVTAQRRAYQQRHQPAATQDGRPVQVLANVSSLAQAQAAQEAGAEGIGLLRSEFLFLADHAPDEQAQYAAYRAIAQALPGRPLVIRSLDVGGDKPLPYAPLSQEANPFLGLRGLRLCLAEPELFIVQLRAIWRAAAHAPIRLMLPMVSSLDEVRQAKTLLAEARQALQAQGEAIAARLELGIMVEVPSVALRAKDFIDEVDFFSIGSNDLSQYTLAAERGNAKVAALADALQPAVLSLIATVTKAAQARGKSVSICGELASLPQATALLVGLGVDSLSMNAAAIPGIKAVLRRVNYAAAKEFAQEVLQLPTKGQVQARLATQDSNENDDEINDEINSAPQG